MNLIFFFIHLFNAQFHIIAWFIWMRGREASKKKMGHESNDVAMPKNMKKYYIYMWMNYE